MKKIFKVSVIYLLVIQLGYSSNPSSGWDLKNEIRFDFKKIKKLLDDVQGILPVKNKPAVTGSGVISLKAYEGESDCDGDGNPETTLQKRVVSGQIKAEVSSGNLPLPGLSLPAGIGGAYIKSSAFIAVSADFNASQCCDTVPQFSATFPATGKISLGGGANIFGDIIFAEVVGSASVSGGVKYNDSQLDFTNVSATASAHFEWGTKFGVSNRIPLGSITAHAS